jgi:hypothetical protein
VNVEKPRSFPARRSRGRPACLVRGSFPEVSMNAMMRLLSSRFASQGAGFVCVVLLTIPTATAAMRQDPVAPLSDLVHSNNEKPPSREPRDSMPRPCARAARGPARPQVCAPSIDSLLQRTSPPPLRVKAARITLRAGGSGPPGIRRRFGELPRRLV